MLLVGDDGAEADAEEQTIGWQTKLHHGQFTGLQVDDADADEQTVGLQNGFHHGQFTVLQSELEEG